MPNDKLPCYDANNIGDKDWLALVKCEFDHQTKTENFAKVAAKIRPIAATQTTVDCELTIEPEHVNRKGTLHGGFSATLIDLITSRAIGLASGNRSRSTVDLSASYLLPVRLGQKVLLKATVLQVNKSMAFAEIDIVREDGKIAVKGKQTMAFA